MQKRNWVQLIADKVDLGTEPLPGIPLIEIGGNQRVLLEGHDGITEYSPSRICVRMSYGCAEVSGVQLCIAKMSRSQMVICGQIQGVCLHRRK